jgi:hypothetical protein
MTPGLCILSIRGSIALKIKHGILWLYQEGQHNSKFPGIYKTGTVNGGFLKENRYGQRYNAESREAERCIRRSHSNSVTDREIPRSSSCSPDHIVSRPVAMNALLID